MLSSTPLPRLGSLWIGDRLSNLERLCAQSFLDHGHELTIYSYSPIKNIPEGVELRDAREIFDTNQILRYNGHGSPAVHANLFRYRLLAKTDFVWVDLDVVALRPFNFSSDYICGWEDDKQLNNAVLRLPHDSVALKRLLKYGPDTVGRPLAAPFLRRLRWLIKMRGRASPIESWPWGATGPTAVTYQMRKSGEISHALPVEAFYPIGWQEVDRLVKARKLEPEDFPRSYGIHLWGKFIHRALDEMGGRPEEGSLLERLYVKHSIGATP